MRPKVGTLHRTSSSFSPRLAFLPARLRGLSLHSWHDTADAASVAGYWTNDTFPSLLQRQASSHTLPDPLSRHIDSLRRLLASAPGCMAVLQAMGERGTSRHIQHTLMDKVVSARRIDLLLHFRRIDDPRNPRHTATYFSACGDSLSTLPTDD